MRRDLGIGITGSGFMGRTHAEAVLAVPGFRLAAVAAGRRAGELAERFGIDEEPDVERLVRRPDVDAVVVTTPHHVHVHDALASIAAGKHVLVEKPLATSVSDCDRMIDAARRRSVTLAVGYHQRFRRNNVEARRLVREGAIGRILTIQATMLTEASLRDGGGWEWWDDPASLGHVLNSAPHGIDLLRWCMGTEVAAVSALSRNFLTRAPVENTTLALLSFHNGALLSLYSTNEMPDPGFPGESFRLRIMGSEGLMDLDPFGQLKLAAGGSWRTVSTQPAARFIAADVPLSPARLRAYERQLRAFGDAIEGKPSRIGSGPDGRAGVEAVTAMLEASRTETVIHLPDRDAGSPLPLDS